MIARIHLDHCLFTNDDEVTFVYDADGKQIARCSFLMEAVQVAKERYLRAQSKQLSEEADAAAHTALETAVPPRGGTIEDGPSVGDD